MKRDRLLAGAIGSLLMVAYALLWVSKWDWDTLPRLEKGVSVMMKLAEWMKVIGGGTVTDRRVGEGQG